MIGLHVKLNDKAFGEGSVSRSRIMVMRDRETGEVGAYAWWETPKVETENEMGPDTAVKQDEKENMKSEKGDGEIEIAERKVLAVKIEEEKVKDEMKETEKEKTEKNNSAHFKFPDGANMALLKIAGEARKEREAYFPSPAQNNWCKL